MRSKEEKAAFIRSLAEAVEIMEERGTIVPVTLLEDYISQMDSLTSNLSLCNSEHHQRQGDQLYRL